MKQPRQIYRYCLKKLSKVASSDISRMKAGQGFLYLCPSQKEKKKVKRTFLLNQKQKSDIIALYGSLVGPAGALGVTLENVILYLVSKAFEEAT